MTAGRPADGPVVTGAPTLAARLACAALLIVTAPACGPSEERISEIELHAAIERLRKEPSGDVPTRRILVAAVQKVAAAIAPEPIDAVVPPQLVILAVSVDVIAP